MSVKPVRYALPIEQALAHSDPLAKLGARIRESNARFAAIQSALPPMLRNQIKAGPVDEEAWSLLASNAGVASKLRQVVPRIEQALRDAGWRTVAIKIRLQSG